MKRPPQISIDQIENATPRPRNISILYLLVGLSLAILGLLILLIFNYDARFLFLMGIFALSIVFGLTAAVLQRTTPTIPIFLAGLGLTVLSFAYQPYGPESKIVGTECHVVRDCVRPVRGGGFPVQYLVDTPGISVRGVLGLEDEFRVWPFIADICFYVCLVELIRIVIRHIRPREIKQETRAG